MRTMSVGATSASRPPTNEVSARAQLIRIAGTGFSVCAVCRTDLHVVDGELTEPKLPIISGHEIVGHIVSTGEGIDRDRIGERIGNLWLGHSCGTCSYCNTGQENLCDPARFTGYWIDGGLATHCVADADYCFAIPDTYDDMHAAPLLCDRLIGYRSLMAAGNEKRLGIYEFGAAAHIVAQIARYEARDVFAFTRSGDIKAQDFARSLGAV